MWEVEEREGSRMASEHLPRVSTWYGAIFCNGEHLVLGAGIRVLFGVCYIWGDH